MSVGQRTALLCALVCGCSEPTSPAPDGGGPPDCAVGLKWSDTACVAVLDDCGDDEVPLLGGGCQQVGVKECAGGLSRPGKACVPIGPPTECPAGWVEEDGHCEPLLPNKLCPEGTMPVIGESTCQPVGDCGSGPFGTIQTDADTIFVDQSHEGLSDGSKAKPFSTIGEAIAVSLASTTIAVAAGTYVEDLALLVPWITIAGRCAQLVTIHGAGIAEETIHIKGGPATLSGLTIIGAKNSRGIVIEGIAEKRARVTIERTVVTWGGGPGIVTVSADLQLVDSVVADNAVVGLAAGASTLSIDRCAITGTSARGPDEPIGTGLQLGLIQNVASTATIRDSVITDNRQAGVSVISSEVTLERCYVARNGEENDFDRLGFGVQATRDLTEGMNLPARLTIRDSLVAENANVGVNSFSSQVKIERSTVRNTVLSDDPRSAGVGVLADQQPGVTDGSELTLKSSLVLGNRSHGVLLRGSTGTIESSVIRETDSDAAKRGGIGISLQPTAGTDQVSTLAVKDSVVAANRAFGVHVSNSVLELTGSVVRDTQVEQLTHRGGVGVFARQYNEKGTKVASRVVLTDCLVADNTHGSFGLEGESTALIERTVIQDTHADPWDLTGMGIFAISDPGLAGLLELIQSVVARSFSAGIFLSNTAASIEGSAIRRCTPDSLGGGDGIQADQGSEIELAESLIAGSERVAILLVGAKAWITRCGFRDNGFGVGLEGGAEPLLEGNTFDEPDDMIIRGRGLDPSTAPEVPPPSDY